MNQSEDDEDDDKLWLLSPAGAEPMVFHWSLTVKSVKGDKKLFQQDPYDIIDTIRLVCEEMPELKKSVSAKIIDTCDVMSFSNMKGLCDIYNQALDRILKQQHHVMNQPVSQRASTDLLRHIMELCYNRAVIDPDTLNQYPPFSPEVYGETSFELVEQMIKSLGITAEDRFVDLGSGVGQVVLHVAAATSCTLSVGIEKAHWPALYAKQMELEFVKWMNFYGKSYNNFSLERGNFLIENYAEIINSATIIFVNNFAFGPDVDHQLKLRFANLKEGARIISSKAFCPLNFHITNRNLGDIGAIVTVKKLSPMRGKVSWTDKPVSYYLHTIDHTMLENFFTATKESAQKSAVCKRRDRLGRPINFSFGDSQGSDSCLTSSCSSTPTTTPTTTPTYRKRTKKTSLRRRLHRMKLSKPIAETTEAVAAIKIDDDTCSSSVPTSEVSSPGDRDKENEQSSGERQSVLVAPLRLRIRTDHHRRRSKRHQAASAAVADTKKTLFRRREHKAKVSSATMKQLEYFHKNVIDTTIGQGYNNNKCFNDAWLAHLASNHNPRPKSLPWCKSLDCFTNRHHISSAQQQANIYEGTADVTQTRNPVVSMCATLPIRVADTVHCNTSSRASSIETKDANLSRTASLFESVPVDVQPAQQSKSSLKPYARSTVLPSASTTPSTCKTLSTCFSSAMPSGVSQDSLGALENLLESFRSQYITMLQVMQTEQYHQHLSSEIQQQRATRSRLQTRVSELQSEITNQLTVGINSLHRRLAEIGTSPEQFLSCSSPHSAEQQELHTCAVAILGAHQLQSHESKNVPSTCSSDVDSSCNVSHGSKLPLGQPLIKDKCDESLPLYSPLVDPPDNYVFSSPQSSADGGMLFGFATPNGDGNQLHGSTGSSYQTPTNAVRPRRKRSSFKKGSRRKSLLEESHLLEVPDIKLEQDFEFKMRAYVDMETEPEMPVLMAESVENNRYSSTDDSVLRMPAKDGSVVDYSQFSYKSVAADSSNDILQAPCDMPIDLTSPLGRSRRAERGSLMSSYIKPSLSLPMHVITASEVTTAPIYSPISSIGDHSPDHCSDEMPPVSITSSFVNRFVGYERDSLLQCDPRMSYWSGAFVNSFTGLPSNVDRSLALLNGCDNASCQDQSCVPAARVDRPMLNTDNHFASYAQAVFTPRPDSSLNYESLPAQEISVTNSEHCMTSKRAAKGRTTDRLLPDIPHMSASQLSCCDFESLTPVRKRRSAAKSDVIHMLENSVSDHKTDNIEVEERKISPDSIRWQQQINSSFEALIKGAYMEAGSEMPRIDGGESPASVSQSNCSALLGIEWNSHHAACSQSSASRTSQSLRHFERRSDSRDSGLGHDVDRRFERHLSPAPPPITPFSPSAVVEPRSPMHGLPSEHSACSPNKVSTNVDYSDDRLYDTLFKKKFNARQLARKNKDHDHFVLDKNALPLHADQQTESVAVQAIRNAEECKVSNSIMDIRLQSSAGRVQLFQRASRRQRSFNDSDEYQISKYGVESVHERETLEKDITSGVDVSSWSSAMTCRSYNTERHLNEIPAYSELASAMSNPYNQLNADYLSCLSGSYVRRTSLHDLDFCIPAAHLASEQRDALSTSR